MDSINIGASNAGDAFYRYKMPKLKSKVEGRGNGVKTNVMNMVEIAKALGRPPSYTTKYFGCELGAQTKFVEDSGLSIVNGAHDQKALAQVLEGFIKKYVQCYSCGNPETIIEIDKRENINLTCKACGYVSGVDPRHKLNTFIIKHPPKKSKKKKAEDKMRRADKEREEIGEALDAEMKKKEKERKKKEKKEKKARKEAKREAAAAGAGEAAGESPAKDAGAAAAEAVEALTLSPEEQRMETLQDMLEDKRSSKEIAKFALKDADTPQEMQERMATLTRAVFGMCNKSSLAEYAQKKAKYFAAAAPEGDEAKQLALLVGVERFLTSEDGNAHAKEAALILKVLYDADAADEEVVVKWYHDGGAAKALGVSAEEAQSVRKLAGPFVTWLETADEDDSSEDED